jgi:hypothetical protein
MQRRIGPNKVGQKINNFIRFHQISRFYHGSSINNNNNNNNKHPIAIVYYNVDINKSIILSDNKGRAAVYLWVHLESGKKYVGSAFDLSIRLSNYFNPIPARKPIYL